MRPDVDVRIADPSEGAVIHRILLDAFEPLRSLYTPGAFSATTLSPNEAAARAREGPVWIASVDGRDVGTVSVLVDGMSGYVRGMGVDPAARSAGVGAALMEAVMADARERPLEHLWLLTTTFLHAAIRLYERWGFSIDPDAEADLHGTPLIRMDRPLG